MITSYRDLDVYQESYTLALDTHKLIKKLPSFELYELGSQMRRGSKSPPANIDEGWGKRRLSFERSEKFVYTL